MTRTGISPEEVFFGTFAYHLQFTRSTANLNQLSFGVSAGIIQHSFDQSSITEFDPLIGKDKLSAFYINMDIGASYYISDFFVHLTAKNILPVKQELFFSDAVPVNQRKYLFSTGYVFEDQGSSWKYQPSMLFQWREATDEKISMPILKYSGSSIQVLFLAEFHFEGALMVQNILSRGNWCNMKICST